MPNTQEDITFDKASVASQIVIILSKRHQNTRI